MIFLDTYKTIILGIILIIFSFFYIFKNKKKPNVILFLVMLIFGLLLVLSPSDFIQQLINIIDKGIDLIDKVKV